MISVNDYVITFHQQSDSGAPFYVMSRKSVPTDQGTVYRSLDAAIDALIKKNPRAHRLKNWANYSNNYKRTRQRLFESASRHAKA